MNSKVYLPGLTTTWTKGLFHMTPKLPHPTVMELYLPAFRSPQVRTNHCLARRVGLYLELGKSIGLPFHFSSSWYFFLLPAPVRAPVPEQSYGMSTSPWQAY